jgi:hypothetical protein
MPLPSLSLPVMYAWDVDGHCLGIASSLYVYKYRACNALACQWFSSPPLTFLSSYPCAAGALCAPPCGGAEPTGGCGVLMRRKRSARRAAASAWPSSGLSFPPRA